MASAYGVAHVVPHAPGAAGSGTWPEKKATKSGSARAMSRTTNPPTTGNTNYCTHRWRRSQRTAESAFGQAKRGGEGLARAHQARGREGRRTHGDVVPGPHLARRAVGRVGRRLRVGRQARHPRQVAARSPEGRDGRERRHCRARRRHVADESGNVVKRRCWQLIKRAQTCDCVTALAT